MQVPFSLDDLNKGDQVYGFCDGENPKHLQVPDGRDLQIN